MERLLPFSHWFPSPAGDSGKHDRLDSGNHPFSSGALLGVLWRQSGTAGQNPCRLQGCSSGPLRLWHGYLEVPLPGCPLVRAGGPLLAPCHPAGWSLILSPHVTSQGPSIHHQTQKLPSGLAPQKAPIRAPSHDPGHDAAGLGIARTLYRLF